MKRWAKYLLIPPDRGRPVVVAIEGGEKIDTQEFKKLMEWHDSPLGMLFRTDTTEIYTETWPEEGVVGFIEPEKTNSLKTDEILKTAHGVSLESRVVNWLNLLSTDWNKAVPLDLTRIFVPDIIGRTAESSIEEVTE